MRFSAMRFSIKVFEHAKIARWRHCNADSLKTLKANYMLIRLLCVYRMTNYVCKILLWNSKRLLRKLQKNHRGLLFSAPCTPHIDSDLSFTIATVPCAHVQPAVLNLLSYIPFIFDVFIDI